MKFYTEDGVEADIKQFEAGSLVVMRVTKPMTKKEWSEFIKRQRFTSKFFRDQGIKVLICPDWVEFKEWR